MPLVRVQFVFSYFGPKLSELSKKALKLTFDPSEFASSLMLKVLDNLQGKSFGNLFRFWTARLLRIIMIFSQDLQRLSKIFCYPATLLE